jgi:DNA-binding PadR family transcriptional regulator
LEQEGRVTAEWLISSDTKRRVKFYSLTKGGRKQLEAQTASHFDPATFVAVSFLLMLVALGAATIPAWRVMRAHPVISLRAE